MEESSAVGGRASGRMRLRRGSRTFVERARDSGVLIGFIVLCGALSLASPDFVTSNNLLNILDQSAALGIIACAGTLVIIAGGFDLSTGAIYALTGLIAAEIAQSASPWLGFGLALLAGVALGAANGGLVTVLRINSFIATLASSLVIRGTALVITGGFLVAVEKPSFQTLGLDEIFGIKVSVWLFAFVFLICTLLLSRTTFGRAVYAVGASPAAARLSGIRIGWVQATTFMLSGLAAALAGIIAASRVSTGQADAGQLLELQAIAAIVIGGTSIYGGEGAVWRSVVGVLLLAVIGNGFNILGVDPLYQSIVQGGVIILAVAVDAYSKRATI